MKLKIRLMKAEDVRQCFDYFNKGVKDGAYIYNGNNEGIPKATYERLERELKANDDIGMVRLVCEDLDTKQILGDAFFSVSFGRKRHVCDFSWFVNPDFHGHGIASKLARELLKIAKEKGYKKIEASIAEKNIASIRVAEKVGMKLEGRQVKSHLMDDGEYIDILLYGRWLG